MNEDLKLLLDKADTLKGGVIRFTSITGRCAAKRYRMPWI